MKTVLGLFFCFGLATLGSSLECEVCSELGTSCSGSIMPCEASQDTCLIAMTEQSLVGVPMQTINKGCGSLDACRYGPKYMNFGSGKTLRSSVTCCVGDSCQTSTAQVPPAITEPNGKQCPACYALSSTSCPAETVDCRGPEDHCLDLAVRVIYGGNVIVNTAQKGCVSKSACDELRRGETTFSGGSATVLKAECRPATIKA
uniref:phospholipase A2 inhibitor gamma subunit B-like n=1 Tax=Euleptes europaea TaxID=460621 RepID=UPI002540EB5D|nr:phospholipase A2 inhibitor gamma subunit B-like [Euleptes europaea]